MRRPISLRGSVPSFLPAAIALALLPAINAAAAATVQFSAAGYRVSEAAAVARISLVRSGTLNEAVSVECRTDGGTATEGSDYTGVLTNLTLAAGQASATVVVPLLMDTLNEPNETVGLVLSGAGAGARNTAVLTVVDNDPAGVISLGKPAFSVNETGVTAVVQLVRVGGTASEAAVVLETADGTAAEGVDYTPVSTWVVFGANEKSKSVPIAIADDALPEGNETVLLRLSKPDGGAKLGVLTNATLTIVDDEIALSFSKAAYPVSERSGVALITVLRSGPLKPAVTVHLSTTQDGTAIPLVEYKPITNQVVTFPAGVAARTMTLALKDDTLDDGDKTVELALTDPSAPAQLGTIQKTVVTLADNDAGGTINFSAPTYNTTETAVKAPILVRRTGGAASGVTVTLRTSNGTATAGEDYREVVTNLTFKAGELVKTVFIPILNDALVEDTETVTLSLSDATGGAQLGTNAQASLRIANDDRGGSIQFSSASYTVGEKGTNAVITLTRSSGLAAGVTVEMITTGGTATDGEDYTGLPLVADFLPGATTTKVFIPIHDDTEIEGQETIALRLQNPTGGATLGLRTNATVTIKVDEVSLIGTYTVSAQFTYFNCPTSSDNHGGTLYGDLVITSQSQDSFDGQFTLVGTRCSDEASVLIQATMVANDSFEGTFRDEFDRQIGTFTCTVSSGTMRFSVTGQDPMSGCRISASLTATPHQPPTTGFAPANLRGVRIVAPSSRGATVLVFPPSGNLMQQTSGDGTVSQYLYTYSKTGPNTGVMRTAELNEDYNNRISLTFTSSGSGFYSFVDCEGDAGSGSFTFTR